MHFLTNNSELLAVVLTNLAMAAIVNHYSKVSSSALERLIDESAKELRGAVEELRRDVHAGFQKSETIARS